MEGAGTLVLSGANSFDGALTVDSGIVDLESPSAAGQGGINFGGGGELEFAFADAPAVKINDFVGSSSIEIKGFVSTSESYDAVTGKLELSNGSASVDLNFRLSKPSALDQLVFTRDGAGDTIITTDIPCFCPGTLILTEKGERAVEGLAIGDRVVTLSGQAREIRWIGRRGYDPARIEVGRTNILPILIRAGALGENTPRRDLHVSPGHAFYFEGALIPAGDLVNCASIVQRLSLERVEYIHLELETHDVIFAEGAEAESYLDEGNRRQFENAASWQGVAVGPEFAPRLREGERVMAIRRRLADRARTLGFAPTRDRAVHLIVDGGALWPTRVDGEFRYVFEFARRPRSIRLVSRASVPAVIENSPDTRNLGLPLARLIATGENMRMEISHDDPSLRAGFHEAEATHRWTDGDAHLPVKLLRWLEAGARLEVRLAPTGLSAWARADEAA